MTPGDRAGSTAAVLERLVLDALARTSPLSRPQLCESTGLSRATVAGLVEAMVLRGELVEASEPVAVAGRGRRATAYERADLKRPVILVELGKDRTTSVSAVVDGRRVTSLDNVVDWPGAWADWSAAVSAALGCVCGSVDMAPRLAVLCTPFPVVAGHGAPRLYAPGTAHGANQDLLPNAAWWIDDPRQAVADLLGLPLLVVNGANIDALGESYAGGGQDADVMIYVSVRDDISAGIVASGRLLIGSSGCAGELAHVQVVEHGQLCVCGNRGCLWTVRPGGHVSAGLETVHGDALTIADLDALVARGDFSAVRHFRDLGRLIGRALSGAVSMVAPNVVLVDRTVGRGCRILVDGMVEELSLRCAPQLLEEVSVAPSNLDDPRAHGVMALAHSGQPVTLPSSGEHSTES